jgi:phosphotransacetylase
MPALRASADKLITAAAKLRVLLWESGDERVITAARYLATVTNIEPVLLGSSRHRETRDSEAPQPAILMRASVIEEWRRVGFEGIPRSDCEISAAALRLGLVDAAVGGAATSSAEVLRAGFKYLGMAAGRRTVSIGGLVEPIAGPLTGRLLLMTDTGAVVEPTADQFVDIAVNALETWTAISEDEPHIAFLSASTRNSCPAIQNLTSIRDAVASLRRMRVAAAVDGELQFVAAVSPQAAAAKGAQGRVPGQANILVFPNLDSCNIGYKIAEYVGGAHAVPVTQGFARSFHDVSRGSTASDLMETCVVAALVAMQDKTELRAP